VLTAVVATTGPPSLHRQPLLPPIASTNCIDQLHRRSHDALPECSPGRKVVGNKGVCSDGARAGRPAERGFGFRCGAPHGSSESSRIEAGGPLPPWPGRSCRHPARWCGCRPTETGPTRPVRHVDHADCNGIRWRVRHGIRWRVRHGSRCAASIATGPGSAPAGGQAAERREGGWWLPAGRELGQQPRRGRRDTPDGDIEGGIGGRRGGLHPADLPDVLAGCRLDLLRRWRRLEAPQGGDVSAHRLTLGPAACCPSPYNEVGRLTKRPEDGE
jgi:hypothetical protein